jgi:hypothetical protein
MTERNKRPVCGARTIRDGACQSTIIMANGRCRIHGGATPRGFAHPNVRHGLRSKDLPTRLVALFERGLPNAPRLSLDREIHAVDEMILDRAHALLDGSGSTVAELRSLLDQRASLVTRESQRIKLAQESISDGEARTFFGALLSALVRHVHDPDEVESVWRDACAAIGARGLGGPPGFRSAEANVSAGEVLSADAD